MPWSIGEVPESVEKLSGDAQVAWVKTANRAIEEGYEEGQALAIAWTVAKKVDAGEMPDVIYNYVPWRPGRFRAAVGGEFDIEPDDVDDVCYAVNHLYSLGVPLKLMSGYHGLDGQKPYPVGLMPAARVRDDGKMASALVGDKFHMEDVRQGVRTLSIEADREYQSPAYTGEKTFNYWPTAWAILPEAVQPGVPPGEPVAAAEDENHIRLCASETAPDRGDLPHGKEADTMDTKELEARIAALEESKQATDQKVAALEKERDELKAQNEELAAKVKAAEDEKAQAELAAAEAAVTERAKTIMAAEARPGVREKMEAKLAAAEGVEAKGALLDAWESVMDESQIKEAKLRASESKPDHSEDNPDSFIQAAEAIAKEKGIPISDAYALVGKE